MRALAIVALLVFGCGPTTEAVTAISYGTVINVASSDLWDSKVAISQTSQAGAGSVVYDLNESYARTVFTTDAAAMQVNCLNDIAANPNVHLGAVGVVVDGVNQGGGVEGSPLGQSLTEFIFSPVSAGTRTVQIIHGAPAKVAGVVRGAKIISYQLQSGHTGTIVSPTAPTHRWVWMGDSISNGGGTDGQLAYLGRPMLMRANMLASSTGAMAGGSLTVDAVSSGQLSDIAGTGGLVTARITRLTAQLDGTVENRIGIAYGTNDWGLGGLSAATSTSHLGALLSAINTAFPGTKILVVTPLHRSGESTPNAGGSTLADYRTSYTTECALHSDVTVLDGAGLVTYPTNFSADLLHPNNAGQVQGEAGIRAVAGY